MRLFIRICILFLLKPLSIPSQNFFRPNPTPIPHFHSMRLLHIIYNPHTISFTISHTISFPNYLSPTKTLPNTHEYFPTLSNLYNTFPFHAAYILSLSNLYGSHFHSLRLIFPKN